jgi:pyruvate-formate lyase-activating enzyme
LKGERAFVAIAGGEPTIHPEYLDFLRHILSKHPENSIHTTTNGSRDPRFYAELLTLSSIGFSAHLETLVQQRAFDRFVQNLEACVQRKKQGFEKRFLQVRIMLKPGTLELARKLDHRLREIPGVLDYANLRCDLLHQAEDREILPVYSLEEIRFAEERSVWDSVG